jgi:hypothetical protein
LSFVYLLSQLIGFHWVRSWVGLDLLDHALDALFLVKDSIEGIITVTWILGPFVLNPVEIWLNFDISVPHLQGRSVKDEVVELDHIWLLNFSDNSCKSLRQDSDQEVEQHDLDEDGWKYENAPLWKLQIVEVKFAESEKVNVSHSTPQRNSFLCVVKTFTIFLWMHLQMVIGCCNESHWEQ